ncbi:ATP-dependent endonuclease [Verrucomicrobia bacterium LW23]|nr:ATP-dependent endonuclease [Verrucomicrobia bacterium LW23]
MLTRLNLHNFRCFSDHTIEFSGQSLLVGKNNAGKSTCVEGLRLVSLVTERMYTLGFKSAPESLDMPLHSKGLRPSIDSIFIHSECLFYGYGNAPAKVTATFTSGSKIEILVGEKMEIFAQIFLANGKRVTSRDALKSANIPKVSILPQIFPLSIEEHKLTDDYIKNNLHTLRSSLHFRNQILLYKELLPTFKNLVADSWPGLSISQLEEPDLLDPKSRIALLVRDGDFTAEAAWMGHGVQMWLQTLWFLCRNFDSEVIILDEPDVYMHADLQRRLIRMLLQQRKQFIVATHSPEMLAEVEPESIVALNRVYKISKSAVSHDGVQELLRNIGSIHNLSLARLGLYNRIILLEGEDMAFLKAFQNALEPNADIPIDVIPNSDIGGWSMWPSVINIAHLLRKNNLDLRVICILDRDYHDSEEIDKRYKEAREYGVDLTIWKAKEIENYALVPEAVYRLIKSKSSNALELSDVADAIRQFAEELKESTIDSYADNIIQIKRKSGLPAANSAARSIVNDRWNTNGGPYTVSGKALFASIARWSQEKYKVSITVRQIIKEMQPNEVPDDIATAIKFITQHIADLKA